ncbi:hypothetical protein MtrunA17_Chr7g0268801 [Medicago truncatula]|uniref:Uncharacterized protein n=1 Tax=Medicago truncatula TaxID=3880 RepID=A0A396H6M3_MEDTR|nr:hypothetical protein MtrunA17_Chr7g0268801 [Medicago truncatula]
MEFASCSRKFKDRLLDCNSFMFIDLYLQHPQNAPLSLQYLLGQLQLQLHQPR